VYASKQNGGVTMCWQSEDKTRQWRLFAPSFVRLDLGIERLRGWDSRFAQGFSKFLPQLAASIIYAATQLSYLYYSIVYESFPGVNTRKDLYRG
jgi:hypothetical protein